MVLVLGFAPHLVTMDVRMDVKVVKVVVKTGVLHPAVVAVVKVVKENAISYANLIV